jgi:YjbE family integral membrane protein
MAARSLPERQQKKAIFWGSTAAIAMRVVLTALAVQLLRLPLLKIIGSVALLWIGTQLMLDSDDGGEVQSEGTMAGAIRTILVADLVMSVDNVIAVAGAADRAPPALRIPLLIVGLALSIPLIIAGSTLLVKVMAKYPIVITLGAALLGFLAGELFVTDPAVTVWFHMYLPEADMVLGAAGAVLVIALGRWLRERKESPSTTP